MGLSDVAFFVIKHTPLPNENHSVWSPIYPMGVADMLGPGLYCYSILIRNLSSFGGLFKHTGPHHLALCQILIESDLS